MRIKAKNKAGGYGDKPNLWVRFFLLVGLAAFMIVIYALFKETYKKYQIQKEVDALRLEAENLENGNEKMRGLVEYFKTDNYSEKEAREKLNLKKEGEKVVVLRSEDAPGKEARGNTGNAVQEENNMPNPFKWWDYFFKNKK